ncbi:MAG: FHA domain-containing protein [Candidatus Acidiferrales bacterium]
MPRIVIHDKEHEARVFEITGDRPVSIGRAKSSDVMLDDASVSRIHAVIRVTIDGQWQIVDRGSANGLNVNGAATKETVLRPNDEILIGVYRLRFEDSKERKITSYGTVKLPKSVTDALGHQVYSGLSMNVEAVGAVSAGREGAAGHEKRLLGLLDRVKLGLAEMQAVEKLTPRVLDYALEIDGVERGFVMLLADDAGETDLSKGNYNFAPASIRYRKNPAGEQPRSFPQLTISRSIIRQVMQLGLPMLVSDGQTDPRFSASRSVANSGIQSAMCAPLGMGKRLRGLLYADNLSRKGMFTVDDLNGFAVIAVQAGLAIERIRGREETSEKLKA